MRDGYAEKKRLSKAICLVVVVAVVFRVFTAINYGESLRILSDDRHYLYGAINFLKNGHIAGNPIYEPTMISMPGQFLWLALFMKIFGYTQSGLVMVRVCFAVVEGFTTFGIYKLAEKLWNGSIGLAASLFYAVGIPFVCMSNLFLSETMTVFGIVWFFIYAISYCETRNDRDFLLMFFFYFIAFMQRATIALLPVTLCAYYYRKKFPLKLLLSRCLYAGVLIAVLLSPWWYRNYLLTGTFVPTTVSGDALLGGTYSSRLHLEDEMSLNESRVAFYNAEEVNPMYVRMERQAEYGKERLRELWEKDKEAVLYTYLVEKPILSWSNTTRYGVIYDISYQTLDRIHKLVLGLAALGLMIGCAQKKYRGGTGVFLLAIAYFTVFTALFLPFPRYNYPVYFAVLAFAALAVYTGWEMLQKILERAGVEMI